MACLERKGIAASSETNAVDLPPNRDDKGFGKPGTAINSEPLNTEE